MRRVVKAALAAGRFSHATRAPATRGEIGVFLRWFPRGISLPNDAKYTSRNKSLISPTGGPLPRGCRLGEETFHAPGAARAMRSIRKMRRGSFRDVRVRLMLGRKAIAETELYNRWGRNHASVVSGASLKRSSDRAFNRKSQCDETTTALADPLIVRKSDSGGPS